MTSPLRLLLWLKWTLIWRGYRRSKIKIFGTVILLLAFLPISLFAAGGVWWATSNFPHLAPSIARDALAVIYLIWALTPLLGFQMNESYDLTKLFAYPISYRQIFFGSVLGSLFDLPVILVLPALIVLLIVFSASFFALLVNSVLLALFLLHTLALGQAITLALIGFLRSRRFRDITIVLFPLIGMAYYIGQQTFFRQIGTRGLMETNLLDAPAWRVADWLPPGYAARGLSLIADGRYPAALLLLLLLAAVSVLTLWVAATTLKNLYLGDAGPQIARAASKPQGIHAAVSKPDTINPWLSGLPADIAAMVGKEFTYFRREPQYKAMAVQIVYTLVAVAAPFLLRSHGGGIGWLGDWLFFGLSGTLLLSMLPLLFNIFGGEGAAITVLFSLPTRRRSFLLGKNAAHLCLLLGLNFVGLIVMAFISHRWDLLPLALVWVMIAAPVLIAVGNLVSIRFPHRMLVRGQRWQKGGVAAAGGGDGSGCAYGLLYLLAYLGACAALLPVIAAIMLPGHFSIASAWYALSLPLAFIYAIGLYILLLGRSEVWLLAREPEIAQKIVPAE